MKKIFTILLTACLVAACSSDSTTEEPDNPAPVPTPDPEVTTYSVNGSVQKGPFTQGTSITIQALDDALNPTGKNYQTKTTDDAGTFKISNQIESRYVEIIATGYYFNEVSGRVSNSTITLRSLSDLTETGRTNVNLLTTLESDRIRNLVVSGGKSVQDARKQAEKELFEVFHIPNAVSGSAGFDKMDITQGGESNAVLLAISASLQGKRSEGELSELISKIASEIESSGALTNDLVKEQIREGGMTVNAQSVRANLQARYETLGLDDYEIPPFEDYLDVNGNGSVDKQDNWLILSEKEFHLSDEGGTIEVELQHNVDYDVVIEDDGGQWIVNNATRGFLETDKLRFTVKPNETYDARYARIAVKDRSSSYTEYITVSQKQLDALTVTSDRFEIDKRGGTIEIEVKANVAFTVEIPAECISWISRTPSTRGLTATTMQFDIAPSDEPEVREGSIIVSSGSLSETITVYQTGEKVLVLNQREYTVSDQGATIDVEVTGNVDYEIVMPQVDWISQTQKTRGIITNTRSFTIAPNTTYDAREAEIVFRDKNSNLQEIVTVYQTQKDAIVVAKKSYQFDNAGGNLTLELQANVDVEVEIPETSQPWISQAPQSRGLTARTLNFTIAANSGYDKREGEIIVKNAQKGLSETIKIYQTEKNALILTKNEFTLPADGDSFAIEVKSNVNFTVSVEGGGSWLHRITTRSLTSHTLNFRADANTTYDSREATITIADKSNNLRETVRVHQSPKDAIIIGTDKFEVPFTGGDVTVNVRSNVDYSVDVTEGSDWITRAPETRALKESSFTLQVAKNETYKQRTGKVSISANSGITQTVTITQAPNAEEHCLEMVYSVLSTDEETRLYNPLSYGVEWPLWGEKFNFTITRVVYDEEEFAEKNLRANFLFKRTGDVPVRVYYTGVLTEFVGFEKRAFYQEELSSECRLKSVDLPETVTKVGIGRLDALTSVTIRNPNANIPLFEGCPRLESFGGPLASDDKRCIIRDGELLAFAGANIREYVLPEGITSIRGRGSYGVFSGRKELTKITLPNSLTVIGNSAFEGTAISQIIFPASLTSIGERAFNGCEKLETIVLPDGCAQLGNSCFSNCEALVSVVLPESITTIPDGAFGNCSKLSEVSLPHSLVMIGGGAFSRCPALQNIALPENLSIIRGNAFAESGLRSIYLHKNIKTIEEGAFNMCKSLQTVEYDPDIQLKVLREKVFAYTGLKTIVIPKNIEIIENHAFWDCDQLTSVYFAEGSRLTRINDGYSYSQGVYGAFERCHALSVVELPASLVYIGIGAFSSTGLSTIKIPDSVTTIAPGAFFRSDLKTIEISDRVTAVGSRAFYECKSLESVTIGSGVVSLAEDAFQKCPALKKFVSRSSHLETTDDARCLVNSAGTLLAFAPVGAPKVYTIPAATKSFTIQTIGVMSFTYSDISTLTLPETITTIGMGAFINSNTNKNIKTLYCKAPNPPKLIWTDDVINSSIGGWMVGISRDPLPQGNCTFYVPSTSVEAYTTAWKKTNRTVVGYDY